LEILVVVTREITPHSSSIQESLLNTERTGEASSRFAVRAGHSLDVISGELKGETVVIVDGSRIVSVEQGAPPSGLHVVDLGERVLMPGLIDAHTHILLHENTSHADFRYQIMEEYPSHRVARAVRALSIALNHGFTTMRDLETEGAGYDDVGLRDAVREGIINGPRLQVAGPALSSTGSYPVLRFRPDWRFPSGVQVVDGADDCRRAVREQISYGTDWVKLYANAGAGSVLTDDGYIESAPNWTKEEFAAMVDEAHVRGRRVAAHATSDTGVAMALSAGVDSIEHGYSIRPSRAREMAEKGIFLCPTLMPTHHVAEHRARERGPIWQQAIEVQVRSFTNCLEAGVKVAFGTDAGCFDWTGRNQAEEFTYMVEAGMEPLEAIRSATTVAADLLGLSEVTGRLEANFAADFIAVPGDPREHVDVLQKVEFVVSDGRIVKAVSDSVSLPGSRESVRIDSSPIPPGGLRLGSAKFAH
jgi:imidazolonepropionase-like amidohydrolase